MPRFALLATAVVVLAVPVRADDDARKVIERAVAASGGEAALKKHPAGEYKGEGTVVIVGETVKYTTTVAYALPDKFKVTLDYTSGVLGKQSNVVVVNGDKVKRADDAAGKLTDAAKAASKQLPMMQEVNLLYPLLDKDKFTLKAEPAAGKEAAAVLVTRKGLNDVRLFFDADSGLPVRYTRKGWNPEGKEVDEEATMGEYKEFAGVKMPTVLKIKQAGKDYMTLKVTDVKLLDKADTKAFE